METRVGVREEETTKGNDEICVLFLSFLSLFFPLSLSLSRKKEGRVESSFLQKKKKKKKKIVLVQLRDIIYFLFELLR